MDKINFEKFQVNQQLREITFSCASDYPYKKYDQESGIEYNQILVINENAVDLSRLNDSAPLLFNHDSDKIIGVVKSAWILENKIFIRVKFSENYDLAERIFKDVLEGILKNVSIGYTIDQCRDVKEDGQYNRYCTKWMIYQASIVGIPADPKVGIRQFTINKKKGAIMDENKQEILENISSEQTEQKENAQEVELEKIRSEYQELRQRLEQLEGQLDQQVKEQAVQETEQIREQEQVQETEQIKEVQETVQVDNNSEQIEQIGKDFNVSEQQIRQAIQNKISVRDFKKNIFIKNTNQKEQTNMNKRDFINFIKSRNYEQGFNLRDFSGFGGMTGEGGNALIGTEVMPLVQALTRKIGVKGFRTLTGLTQNVTIPVQTARPTAEKKGLRESATTSSPVFENKTLSPVKISGNTIIGAELLYQANDDIIAYVIDSLTRQIAYKTEAYILEKVAEGAGGEVTYSDLKSISFSDVLAFEAAVGSYDLESLAYVMNPSARACLKGTPMVEGDARFICENDTINGYKVNVTGCIDDNNTLFFGDWSKLVVGVWGEGLQVTVNPYSYAKEGNIQIVASVAIDAVPVNENAFVIGKVQQ